MHKLYLSMGAFFAGIGVIFGAFGAHKLKQVAPEAMPIFQTGVQYQMYHAFALIALAIIADRLPLRWVNWSAISFIGGIFLFSGSLYLLAIYKATGRIGLNLIGILTPFGGLFFILGWLFFLIAISKIIKH